MVLLNLNAHLKSLTLPFGRHHKMANANTESPEQTSSRKGIEASAGCSSTASVGRGDMTCAGCSSAGIDAQADIASPGCSSAGIDGQAEIASPECSSAGSGDRGDIVRGVSDRAATLPRVELVHLRACRSMSTTSGKVKLRRRLTINPSWKAGSRDIRRSRSLNARSNKGMTEAEAKTPTTPTDSPSSEMGKRHKPLVVKKIASSELEEKQAIAGFLERKSLSALWIRYWYVLHEGTLFCYLTSDDNVTVDVLNLHGYTISCLVDKIRGKRFVLQLSHDNFTSLFLSMESREEMENWRDCLEQAIQQPSSHIQGDDLDKSACAGCDKNRLEEDMDEKRKQVKQRLLEEMLRQKHELERKQAERLKKQRNGPNSPDRSPSSPYPPDFTSDEQRTSDVTRLRQRRMSTQLKVETIQRQIDKPSGTKRSLFGFGKVKKLDENKNVFLQDQLKELTDKLHKIDTDLIQAETVKRLESYDFNQNKKQAPLSSLDGDEPSEEESKRNAGLKNAVQKWTNKTFSKVSVKKKHLNNSNLPLNGSMPNLKHSDLNGNGDLDDGFLSDSDRQDFTGNDNSVTDLTRPLSDLKLDLNTSYTQQNGRSGSTSPSSVRNNRSNSKSSTLSSLSSPRREIDPSVLAEIDAFEELTRQVLGARSKEMPTK